MYSIGLDIGIASVGWSVISSSAGRIIDLGVNVFPARDSNNNVERRESRGARRLGRRRVTRLNDAKKILNEIGMYRDPEDKNLCPYEIRVRGLTNKLSKSEIFIAATHIIKKRGISYLDEESEDAQSGGSDYKEEVNHNAQLLKEFTPGEIQLKRLNENGRVRTGINNRGEFQLNVFTVRAYAKELEIILHTQQEYYPEMTDEIINKFISNDIGEKAGLVYRKRPYYHGPGNKANNSPYGRWADFKVKGKPANNIFDQLIGKDMIGELRASSISLTAQKYNLLNDLNNLTIKRENPKVTPEEKSKIISHLMNEDVKSFGPSSIPTFLDVKMEDIKGWRIDKKEKPLIHSMKEYRAWKKVFSSHGVELNDVPNETVDEITKIVTLNTDIDAIINTIELELPYLEKDLKTIVIEEFRTLRKKGSNSTWHNFSAKLMNLLIPDLLNTSDEQNTILERFGLKKDLRGKYSDYNNVPINEIVNEIYNPTVSRSVRQAFSTFNELVKRYGKENISHLTIEMPRDKNEDDQKERIKKMQKNNEDRRKNSEQYILDKSGWSTIKFESAMTSRGFAAKLLYYYEQDGKCAYSGVPIKPDDLLLNKTEIDHIIPLSISLDDSINNKVLVLAKANQEKGQRSPYQAFREGAKLGRTWAEYKTWVMSRNYKKYKRNLLLEERDIFDPETREKFIARNLNDTRYASRTVLNVLQSYFYGSETIVSVVNGSFTHTLRKKWGNALEKSRETHHHHAVDATLCAVKPFVKIDRYKFYVDPENNKFMRDQETGELIPYREYKKLRYYETKTYIPQWDDFIEKLLPEKLYPRIKFSHQVNKKYNRKISNATIYSTRTKKETVLKRGKEVETEDTFVIDKIKDIYTNEGWNSFKKYHEKLIMKDIDPKTYSKLVEIMDEYPDYIEVEQTNGKVKQVKRSPFLIYCEEHNIPAIQKYSKKGNGPIVRSVKYYRSKLGGHINITKDNKGNDIEETKHRRKVILESLNPWRTDVYYNKEKDLYELLGIKYNHLKYIDRLYGIPKETYTQLKVIEGIGSESEFCFSLYKNNLVKIEYKDEAIEGLYHARNETSKNYFEIKPIDKNTWDSKEKIPVFGQVAANKQFIKGLKVNMKISKYHVTKLGTKFRVTQEELKNIIE